MYPKGGVGKLAESLVSKILEWNGNIKTGTKVIKINLAENTLFDDNGYEYRYRYLIWAADLKTFYRISDTTGLKSVILEKFEKMKKRILSSRGGDSVFTAFLR